MAKKVILALIVVIILAITAVILLSQNDTVSIYIDGENVTVESNSLFNRNNLSALNKEICRCAISYMDGSDADITHLKGNISGICESYGMENAEISIDSIIGEDQVPVIVRVCGTSMLPTLQDGQPVLLNKTHNVHVGDIVVAESPEYGGIIKRVGAVNGNSIYLVSDNKQVSYEYINGQLYKIKGITTWVDISNISGAAIAY